MLLSRSGLAGLRENRCIELTGGHKRSALLMSARSLRMCLSHLMAIFLGFFLPPPSYQLLSCRGDSLSVQEEKKKNESHFKPFILFSLSLCVLQRLYESPSLPR